MRGFNELNIRVIVFFSLFLMTGLFVPRSATASDCAAMIDAEKPTVSVNIIAQDVEFDVTLSKFDLAKFDSKSKRHDFITPRALTGGVSEIEVGGLSNGLITMSYNMKTRDEDGGCRVIEHVTLNLTLEPKIYIAHEYQEQDCWFRDLLIHESKHVEKDKEVLDQYKDRFNETLGFFFSMKSDYIYKQLYQQEYEDALTAGLSNLFSSMLRDRNFQQQKIDSISEYRQLGNGCYASTSAQGYEQYSR